MLSLLRSGLFRRLFVSTLLVTIAIMVVSLVSSSLEYQKHIRAEIELRHDSVARRIAMEIGLFFNQASNQMAVVAGFANALNLKPEQLSRALNELCLDSQYFMEVAVARIDGQIAGSSAIGVESGIVPHPEAIAAARMRRNWFSKVHLDNNRVPYVEVSSPIMTYAAPKGMAIGRVNLKKLWYWIDEIQEESNAAMSVVKSESGLVIADQSKNRIGHEYRGWTKVRKNRTFETINGPHYISYHEVPGMDLTIVTVSRLDTFEEYLERNKGRMAGIALGLVALAALFSALLSARTSRPVRLLIDAMNEYASTGKKIEPGLEGEYGRIATAFNHVARTLEENQSAMVTQESLATVGRVAAILAHELRHELQMINNIVYLMDASVEEKGDLNRVVAEMARKISSIMELARGSKIEPEPCGAWRLLEDAVEYVHLSEFASKTDLEVEKPAGTQEFTVVADKSKLSMAISNLIRNSVEAQATIIRAACGTENGFAVFSVWDNGGGMTEETLEKMMDPFFTTKQKGYGLGLAFVNSVAKAHGGRAHGENREGDGAIFTIRVPLAGAPKKPARHQPANLAAGELQL